MPFIFVCFTFLFAFSASFAQSLNVTNEKGDVAAIYENQEQSLLHTRCAVSSLTRIKPGYFSSMDSAFNWRAKQSLLDFLSSPRYEEGFKFECMPTNNLGNKQIITLSKQALVAAALAFAKDNESISKMEIMKIKQETNACITEALRDHAKALEASSLVYDLKVPAGYVISKSYVDKNIGFKAYVLDPIGDADLPSIIAIAGTENKEGAFSDLTLGSNQFLEYRNKIIRQALVRVETGKEVIFTGHSLGGGLSQAFAYESIMALNDLGSKGQQMARAHTIHSITWNAFGSLQLIAHASDHGSNLHDARIHEFEFVNYRTKKDIVSLIGNHIGEVIDLPDETISNKSIFTQHKISVAAKEAGPEGLALAKDADHNWLQNITYAWITGVAELNLDVDSAIRKVKRIFH